MSKLAWLDTDSYLLFSCPGCGCAHYVRVKGLGPTWEWNGDFESPTFAPDITFGAHSKDRRCHFTIVNGVIEFYPDSHHKLAGTRAPLPEWVVSHPTDSDDSQPQFGV